ncbi:MAG TPA: helix-turn-helix transcriptional regulator [Alphaproteobacteria bacterium]|nr:helix-turn-helix transcriptional regulator [Alphaproteobacteria bacterium]
MSANLQFSFSLYEIFTLIGLIQSVAVLVYIVFRSGHVRHVVVPLLCFLVLGSGFLLDFGVERIGRHFGFYPVLQHGVWLAFPAFSVLLIAQIADLGGFPRPIYWGALPVPVIAVFSGWVLGAYIGDSGACHVWSICQFDLRLQVIGVFGILAGLLSFLVLWIGRRAFEGLRTDKESKGERYWLIISFVIINLLLIFASLLYLSSKIDSPNYLLLRNVLGVGAVYLASTSLFRIYPPSIKLEKKESVEILSNEDRGLLEKLKKLLEMDKVYQEPNFSRTDLSRELGTSEARVSKIVNSGFGKSLPQLINEHRVRDSLQLLIQTEAQISVIAEQVGFSSVPTFNRVFKDVMGMSPSEFRQEKTQDL